MSPRKFINQIKTKAAYKCPEFSAFVSAMPLTHKQFLIEKCTKQYVSIYIDDPSESSVGDYAIFRGVASEAELEKRLHTKNAVSFSNPANVIAILVLMVLTINLVKSFV